MIRLRILYLGLVLFLGGCVSNDVKIEGEIADLQGEIKLMMIDPVSLDTLIVVSQTEDTRIAWHVPSLNLPAKVWLEFEGRCLLDFILDERSGMRIGGTIGNDSLFVSGGNLESEYAKLKSFFKATYGKPIEEIDNSISRMVRRTNRTSGDKERLERLIKLKERIQCYRDAYIKRLIQANLSHDLSLVLIENELRDSVDIQRELFHELSIENKNSQLYKVLEKRLHKP
ncbi:hypothetical protein [Odoribacter lunatus]|uniref:hypothetical protein n=1 Tax=Odoribacter lunatus TaxID=2941335 RepID=UPI0020426BB6|nr:hypothetical protein [Odoribacter lunatus]